MQPLFVPQSLGRSLTPLINTQAIVGLLPLGDWQVQTAAAKAVAAKQRAAGQPDRKAVWCSAWAVMPDAQQRAVTPATTGKGNGMGPHQQVRSVPVLLPEDVTAHGLVPVYWQRVVADVQRLGLLRYPLTQRPLLVGLLWRLPAQEGEAEGVVLWPPVTPMQVRLAYALAHVVGEVAYPPPPDVLAQPAAHPMTAGPVS